MQKQTPDTPDAVHTAGHRAFVGGGKLDYWQTVGDRQFRFLLEIGLQPSDTLLDIGCGSLRGGQHFIKYLDPGHYMGVDRHIELIIYGVADELGIDTYREKKPRFAVSRDFEFAFEERPGFALAQSLFTHLTPDDIRKCLRNLADFAEPRCRFFATFINGHQPNPSESASHATFRYSREALEEMGRETGWTPHHIGEWSHPRGQHMMEYRRH